MYYPILKGKRHELSAVVNLSSLLSPNKFSPVIEPVRTSLNSLIKTIGALSGNSVVPIIVINPSQGEFSKVSSAGVHTSLQANSVSSGKFLPCVKIKDASDFSALALLSQHPTAAVYLESDIAHTSLGLLSGRPCTLVNEHKIDTVIQSTLTNLVVYSDSFAKKKRNADYGVSSFYSNLHTTYKSKLNVIGFGDFTIMEEEYSDNGGPAYVVAIHASHIQSAAPNSMHVRHFCSTSNPTVTANLAGKYKEALKALISFDASNPGFFDNTLGMQQFRASYAAGHFPGLGVTKENSITHHIQTICNFI